jgi:hypothetical protein
VIVAAVHCQSCWSFKDEQRSHRRRCESLHLASQNLCVANRSCHAFINVT